MSPPDPSIIKTPGVHAGVVSPQHAPLAQAFEHLPVAVVLVARDGRIAMANHEAGRLFGYRREEMLDQPLEVLVPTRLRRGHPDFRDGYFAQPGARPMGAGRDLRALRKDGSEFPVEIALNPVETATGTMVLSVVVDITARRRQHERFRVAVESAPIRPFAAVSSTRRRSVPWAWDATSSRAARTAANSRSRSG